MNTNADSSLLDFLKKKSLFASSPGKNSRKRSRSRSRESRNFQQRSNYNTFDERPYEQPLNQSRKPKLPYQQDIYRTPNKNQARTFSFNAEAINNNPELRYRPHQEFGNKFENNDRMMMSQRSGERPEERPLDNNMWTGLVTHMASFESARVQSTQCLQNLSVKIGTEISNINYKIDMFNSKMSKILNNEFRTIKEKIYQLFENAFKQSQKYMKQYMKAKEKQLAGELFKMRQILEKEQLKVESMKEELHKPNWRKVAGQILASELEHKIEETVKKSSTIEAGQWELGDISSYRIKNIQAELRQIIKLKT